ncbi:MAG: mucin-desulfating sulfatase, partial [Lachnospiraceae bacterium]|nr:mucin-desulfating sulfatase [Lachnospiraceae bacterium]
CIIDLDTIMPGLAAYDFGDSIRFGAATAAEDEPDTSLMHFDGELYQTYLDGYLQEAGSVLTEEEIASLPWGAKLMTLECGMRFLTDYLEGDHYFKISHPDQNLDRTRTQLKLVYEMEQYFSKN